MARKNRNKVTTAAEQEELDQDTTATGSEQEELEEEELEEEELEEEELEEEELEAEQVETAIEAGREYGSRSDTRTGDRVWTAESRERWGDGQPSLGELLAQANRVNQPSEE